jgi:hypothetical protein
LNPVVVAFGADPNNGFNGDDNCPVYGETPEFEKFEPSQELRALRSAITSGGIDPSW